MLTHIRRPLSRLLPIALVSALTTVALTALPAAADVPSAWEETRVSGLSFVLVLLVIPVSLMLLVVLLASIGSWRRGGEQYVPGQAWRGDAEWFGGRRLQAGEEPKRLESGERGGTSGSW